MDDIKYVIEGILFAAGEPVSAPKLAVVLETDINAVDDAVSALKEEYTRDKRGFSIIDIGDGYQICSRPEYYKYIQEILGEQRNQPLSNAAMEALAIVAYKQPVTKGMIEKIRGVNSDGCVNRLYERGLIDEAGRLDTPGRPILYKTTDTFLRCFGLRTPEDLPPINLKNIIDEEAQGEQLSLDDSIVSEEEPSNGEISEDKAKSEMSDHNEETVSDENTGGDMIANGDDHDGADQ